MDFETTRTWLIGAGILFAASMVGERFSKPLSPLAWVPWTLLQFTSLLAIIVLGAHLFSEWRGVPLEPIRRGRL